LSVQKRVRRSVDIASLSPAQVAILSEAAAILQVDVPDLPKVLSDRPRRLESGNRSQAIPEAILISEQQVPIMDAIPSESKRSTQTMKLSSATEDGPAMPDICDLQSFSLGLIPKQITDCFASFKSPTSRLTPPAESHGEFLYHTKNKTIH
jgi:hypothetical protein